MTSDFLHLKVGTASKQIPPNFRHAHCVAVLGVDSVGACADPEKPNTVWAEAFLCATLRTAVAEKVQNWTEIRLEREIATLAQNAEPKPLNPQLLDLLKVCQIGDTILIDQYLLSATFGILSKQVRMIFRLLGMQVLTPKFINLGKKIVVLKKGAVLYSEGKTKATFDLSVLKVEYGVHLKPRKFQVFQLISALE